MYIPLNEVTAEAMSILKSADSTDRLLARQWAYRALQKIGPFRGAVTNCKIDAKALSIKKPDDFQHPAIDLALYDHKGHEIPFIFKGRGKRVHDKDNSLRPNMVHVSEDEYFFHLSSDADLVSYAKLRYFSIPKDSEGQLLIPEDYVLAIVFFIRYMYSMRQNDNQSEIEANQVRWFRERREARGRAKMPSMLEAEHIAKSWMSVINTFNYDNF